MTTKQQETIRRSENPIDNELVRLYPERFYINSDHQLVDTRDKIKGDTSTAYIPNEYEEEIAAEQTRERRIYYTAVAGTWFCAGILVSSMIWYIAGKI